jgi:hypothetical protein
MDTSTQIAPFENDGDKQEAATIYSLARRNSTAWARKAYRRDVLTRINDHPTDRIEVFCRGMSPAYRTNFKPELSAKATLFIVTGNIGVAALGLLVGVILGVIHRNDP